MHTAQRMVKTGMVGAGVHQVGHAHLRNPAKALEIRVLDEVVHQRVGNGYKPVNRVIEYFELIKMRHYKEFRTNIAI